MTEMQTNRKNIKRQLRRQKRDRKADRQTEPEQRRDKKGNNSPVYFKKCSVIGQVVYSEAKNLYNAIFLLSKTAKLKDVTKVYANDFFKK